MLSPCSWDVSICTRFARLVGKAEPTVVSLVPLEESEVGDLRVSSYERMAAGTIVSRYHLEAEFNP